MTPLRHRTRWLYHPVTIFLSIQVLWIILLVVWVAAFFIPSGIYERDAEGNPIPGSYQEIPACADAADG